MSISNKDEHLNCDCYEKVDKQSMVEIKKFKNFETGQIVFSCNEIILIIDGKLLFNRNNEPGEEFFKGRMVCLAAGDTLHYKALINSRLLILRIEDGIDLCHRFSFERLCNMKKEVARPENLVPLEINTSLHSFVQSLVSILDEGMKCKMYFRNGINLFLMMLHTCFSPQQLCQFFYPILTSNTLFSEQVRLNHLKYRTVNELAAALQMSPKQLNRRFNSVFGQAPYEWMQQEKARLIYTEISRSNKPFKEIAQSYGFTLQANFNRFCHTAFAMNPRDIRKKLKSKMNIE